MQKKKPNEGRQCVSLTTYILVRAIPTFNILLKYAKGRLVFSSLKISNELWVRSSGMTVC